MGRQLPSHPVRHPCEVPPAPNSQKPTFARLRSPGASLLRSTLVGPFWLRLRSTDSPLQQRQRIPARLHQPREHRDIDRHRNPELDLEGHLSRFVPKRLLGDPEEQGVSFNTHPHPKFNAESRVTPDRCCCCVSRTLRGRAARAALADLLSPAGGRPSAHTGRVARQRGRAPEDLVHSPAGFGRAHLLRRECRGCRRQYRAVLRRFPGPLTLSGQLSRIWW